MQTQLSQDYTVDARYRGMNRSVDNAAGLKFVQSYLQRKKDADQAANDSEKMVEDRFLVSGPGNSTYTFKNAFRTSK
jgi:hypothetical protein